MIQEEAGIEAVHTAIEAGVNYFDVSPYYGRGLAEKVLGKALSTIPREKFVVSTKVGRYDSAHFDFSAERVTRSVDESMSRLGLDYIDMVLCHDIEGSGDLDLIAKETIPALRKLKNDGRIGAVGITGYPLEIFPYVLAVAEPGSIDVVLSYCHYNLQNTRLANIVPALEKAGVGVINASPLCMGLLTPRGAPDWHPAPEHVKKAAKEAADECGKSDINLPDLALKFALEGEGIVSTLVGVPSKEILKLNLGSVGTKPDEKAVSMVTGIFEKHNALGVRWQSVPS